MVSGIQSIVKGKEVVGHTYQRQGTYYFASYADGLTATGAGTQANSIAVGQMMTRFSTVASGASCLLPPALAGAQLVIINDGLNTLGCWPGSGDAINAGAANAKDTTVCTAGSVSIFYCVTKGTWRTK
jgi:hypothetical protein